MKKSALVGLLMLVMLFMGVSAPPLLAQDEATPTPTAAPTQTPTSQPTSAPAQATDTPTPSPTPTTATPAPVDVTGLEPDTLTDVAGGTLSLYGTGFTADCAVRLVGYGLLNTTFVHAGALRAQVPPGVPPGTYDVRVTAAPDNVDTLPKALTIVAATPTPKPEAPETPPPPPPPGQPILTIRNYVVEPQQVRPGQEFVVHIEIYNNGSRAGENTLAIFPGGTFLPVGDHGHQLWQLHINHSVVVTQKMRAPKSISNGVHQLNVQLEANDFEGNNYKFPQTIPVEVVGASTGEFSGKPKVLIEDARTTPAVLIPGEPFSLTLRLANRGNRTAINVFATVGAADMAVPAAGGDTVYAELIRIDGVITVTLPLVLSQLDTGGRQNLPVALEYADYSGGAYTDQQNVGVDINTGLARQPQLIIEAYHTQPDFIAPGDTFTLTLHVHNVGGGDAERLTLSLGGEGGAALSPFIPLRSGNVIFVETVPRGGSVAVSRRLLVDGSAETKAYNLPIELAYDDPRATRHQDVQRLSLIVRKRPELQVGFYRQPEMLTVGMPQPLALEVINVGRSAVNIVQMSPSGPQLEAEMTGLPFVGPLDSGGSAPLDLMVTPQESGELALLVAIDYRDDFNQIRTLTETLTLKVGGAPEGLPGGPPGEAPLGQMPGQPMPEEEPPPETLLQKIGRALKGFFGLGS
ncbi:MAG: hypothetical protein ACP5HM_05975 [Anaerolineae bacterium]